MEYFKADYYGREMLEFEFLGRQAKLVLPETPAKGNPWLMKTEYFWAFSEFERDMIDRGFAVAYIANKTRWHDPSDDSAKHELSLFLQKEFGLNEKCIPVGMSCGGLQAVYFAAAYPSDIKGLYLDAPVLNLLSCPGGVGEGHSFMEEFTDHTGMTLTDLMSYRNHPLDNFGKLAENKLPVFLICGDSDKTVPYLENGKLLYDYYTERGLDIKQIIKENCDHHPHGLTDRVLLIEWALSLYGQSE